MKNFVKMVALATLITVGTSGVAQVVVVEQNTPNVTWHGPVEYWFDQLFGLGGSSRWTYTSDTAHGETNYALYRASLPGAGYYKVEVYIAPRSNSSKRVPYAIYALDGTVMRYVDQSVNGGRYVDLGTHPFRDGYSIRLKGSDDTKEGWGTLKIAFDAIRLTYVSPLSSPPPTARITFADMTAPGTFTAKFSATYDRGYYTSYVATFAFPGKTVVKSDTVRGSTTTVAVDLGAENVPRFNRNVNVPISVTVRNGNLLGSASAIAAIPLPVIFVPGIGANGTDINGGDGTFLVLETFFRIASTPPDGVGTPYKLYGAGSPNLTTLTYWRNTDTFREGAQKLQSTWGWLKSQGWADKCVLIGHSKGGLVIRAYLEFLGGGPSTYRAIMANSPHVGAMEPLYWSFYTGIASYPTLWPTYKWYKNPRGIYSDEGIWSESIKELNDSALPAGVKYTLMYSSDFETKISVGPSVLTYQNGAGDKFVPTFSQKGLMPIMPNEGPELASFAGLGVERIRMSGEHTGAFDRGPYVERLFGLAYTNSF